MKTEKPKPAYWKPEPQRISLTWVMLIAPACIYILGVIFYSHNAFIPGLAHKNGHAFGSACMVVGGELGTLAAAAEVFRKYCVVTKKETTDKDGNKTEVITRDTNWLDWLGLLVSLVATLGNLFVVYVSLAPEFNAPWVAFVRAYGPLVLLLCSGVDFYAGVMEFGFLNASYEARYEKWLRDKQSSETRKETKTQKAKTEKTTGAPVAESEKPVVKNGAPVVENEQPKKITLNQWREMVQEMKTEKPQTVEQLNQWLTTNGYEPKAVSTARRWLAEI